MSGRLRLRNAPFALAMVGVLVATTAARAQPDPVREGARSVETAEQLLARFRAGWRAEKEHMRPLDDSGWKTRMSVLQGFLRLGPDSVPRLIKALDDEVGDVRVLAAQALGYLADPRAAARLEKTLAADTVPAARLYAADALGAIGNLTPSPLLKQVEAGDKNRDVQSHVRFALERQGKPLDRAVGEQLLNYDLTRMATARLGEPAPDFALTDALGATIRLSEFKDKSAVVLIFIYGDT